MSAANDGGSAFPWYREWTNEVKGYTETSGSDGITVRDYFAAKAMAALLCCGDNPTALDACRDADKCAVWAYEHADAMLKARDAV